MMKARTKWGILEVQPLPLDILRKLSFINFSTYILMTYEFPILQNAYSAIVQ